MKKIILLSGLVLLLTNLLIGTISSSFKGFNIIVSSCTIVYTASILYVTCVGRLKDGFKVSLVFLFLFVGIIAYILSLFAPNQWQDNWWLIIVIVLWAFEAIMLIVTNVTSKMNQ